MKIICLFLVLWVSTSNADPMDAKSATVLLKKGAALSSTDADELEIKLKKKGDNEELRVQLLAWYTLNPSADLAARRAGRARQILWLIEHDPKNGAGLFNSTAGIYRVHCQGDDLADPQLFEKASRTWIEQTTRNPSDADIRRHAVAAIGYCAPEKAEPLLVQAHDQAGLGSLYANSVLGVTGQSYSYYNDADNSDEAFRSREFSKKAITVLESATDHDLLSTAAITLLRTGGQLWADGKLD